MGIPKLLLGAIVIVLTLAVIIYNDPPTTLCDIQMQAVNKKLAGKFFSTKSVGRVSDDSTVIGASTSGTYQKGVMSAFNFCIETNSPGGCYDIFNRLNYLEKQVRTIPNTCGEHSSTQKVRKALEKGIRLIVKVAWGEKPPENAYEKKAWLDINDIALYCRLKNQHQRIYGKKNWALFRDQVMGGLPEAKTMKRKDIWKKSLLSYKCRRVL